MVIKMETVEMALIMLGNTILRISVEYNKSIQTAVVHAHIRIHVAQTSTVSKNQIVNR